MSVKISQYKIQQASRSRGTYHKKQNERQKYLEMALSREEMLLEGFFSEVTFYSNTKSRSVKKLM